MKHTKAILLVLMVAVGGLLLWRGATSRAAAVPRLPDPAGDVPVDRRTTTGYPIQDPNNPCGPVCVAVVSHLLKKPVGLAEANRRVAPDALGRASMADLIRGLRALGFGAAGVQLKPAACRVVTCPLIVHLDGSHFAVVAPAASDHAVFLDLPFPPAVLTVDQLGERWTGAAVLVTADEAELAAALDRLGIRPIESGSPKSVLP